MKGITFAFLFVLACCTVPGSHQPWPQEEREDFFTYCVDHNSTVYREEFCYCMTQQVERLQSYDRLVEQHKSKDLKEFIGAVREANNICSAQVDANHREDLSI